MMTRREAIGTLLGAIPGLLVAGSLVEGPWSQPSVPKASLAIEYDGVPIGVLRVSRGDAEWEVSLPPSDATYYWSLKYDGEGVGSPQFSANGEALPVRRVR